MESKQYIEYLAKRILPRSLDTAIFYSVMCYFTLAEAALGSQWLPVASVALIAAALAGNKYAHNRNAFRRNTAAAPHRVNSSTKLFLLTDTVGCLAIAVAVAVMDDLFDIAIVIVCEEIIMKVLGQAWREAEDAYERTPGVFTAEQSAELTRLRERVTQYDLVAQGAGAAVGVLLFTVLQVDISMVVVISMVCSGPALNQIQLKLVSKYLK